MLPEEFRKEIVYLSFIYGWSDGKIARLADVSVSTVKRWKTGETCPAKPIRTPLINILRRNGR